MTNEQALMAGRTAAIAGKEWNACPVFEERDQRTYWEIGWREGVLERLSNAEFENDTLRAERDRLKEALSGFVRCIAVTAVGPAWVRQDGTHYPLPGEALRVFRAAIAALEDQPTGEGDDMACNR